MTKARAKGEKASFWLTATKDQARDAGLAAVLVLLLFAHFGRMPKLTPIAAIVLFLVMLWPSLFKPLAKIWFGFSHVLGSVMSRVVLTLVFALVLTPMGLLRNMTGKDPMRVKCWKKGPESVFRVRDHRFDAADVEQPF